VREDSNPRYLYKYAGFQDRFLQPLRHSPLHFSFYGIKVFLLLYHCCQLQFCFFLYLFKKQRKGFLVSLPGILTCPKVPFCPFCPYGQEGQVSFALENLKPVVWPYGQEGIPLPSKKALQKKVRFFCQPFFVVSWPSLQILFLLGKPSLPFFF